MNKRIRQLAEQAGYLPDMFDIGHWGMPECKKFAQLIIEECAKVCEAGITNAQDWDASYWDEACEDCANTIRAMKYD